MFSAVRTSYTLRLQNVLLRFGCAVAMTFLATAVALTLTGPLGLQGVGLLVLPLGVLAAAWLSGMGGGVVSAIGTAVAVAVFFMKPIGSLSIESPRERIALAAFVMACVIESTVVGASRRSDRGLSRLTDAVSASERKFRLLFERNPEPMWIFDTRTRAILAANEAALAVYGYPAEGVQGMRVDELFEPGEGSSFFPSYEDGHDGRAAGPWHHRTRSGEKLEVEIRSTSAAWLGGRACLMVVRDVTARCRAERALRATNEELRRARDAAEQATKARDRFLVVLSHELRTPLTPALLASAALETRPNIPEEIRRSMGLIRAKVKFEAKLIDDLLDVVRILKGDFELEKLPADVTEIVARAVDSCHEQARSKGVDLGSELANSARVVSVDPKRLQQAVTNMLANSIDAAPAGSAVRVWVRDEPTSEVAIGFCHAGKVVDLSRMFDPFERGATPGAPNEWALALGCVISKGIAEACGGRVEASLDGAGTSVVMRFPTFG
jgi:PAS domain S-box-containing protein